MRLKGVLHCLILLLLAVPAWSECTPSQECVQAVRDFPLNPNTLGEKVDAEQRVALMCRQYRECKAQREAREADRQFRKAERELRETEQQLCDANPQLCETGLQPHKTDDLRSYEEQLQREMKAQQEADREVDQEAEAWANEAVEGKNANGIRAEIESQEAWLKDHPGAEPSPDMHARIQKLREKLRDKERKEGTVAAGAQ